MSCSQKSIRAAGPSLAKASRFPVSDNLHYYMQRLQHLWIRQKGDVRVGLLLAVREKNKKPHTCLCKISVQSQALCSETRASNLGGVVHHDLCEDSWSIWLKCPGPMADWSSAKPACLNCQFAQENRDLVSLACSSETWDGKVFCLSVSIISASVSFHVTSDHHFMHRKSMSKLP